MNSLYIMLSVPFKSIITFQDDNDMCSLPPKDLNGKYFALHLRFYRPCTSENDRSDSRDTEHADMMQSNFGQEQESLEEMGEFGTSIFD